MCVCVCVCVCVCLFVSLWSRRQDSRLLIRTSRLKTQDSRLDNYHTCSFLCSLETACTLLETQFLDGFRVGIISESLEWRSCKVGWVLKETIRNASQQRRCDLRFFFIGFCCILGSSFAVCRRGDFYLFIIA